MMECQKMSMTRTLLYATAFRNTDVDQLLNPEKPSFVRFDSELGYIPNDIIMKDGECGSYSTYTYEKLG